MSDRSSEFGFPVRELWSGEPLPDLARIPEDRWKEVLRPLSQATRRAAVNTVRTPQDAGKALTLVGALMLEDARSPAPLTDALSEPPRLPAPAARPVSSLQGRQVNVRLRRSDFAALRRAAEVVDMAPTQLARVFIINGSRRLLYERRRQREAER